VRKAMGFVLIVAGVAVLGVGYSMPSRSNTDEPLQHSEIAKGQPTIPELGFSVVPVDWQNYQRAQTEPGAADSSPSWVVVTLPVRQPRPRPPKVTSLASDRASLARALQYELKRVGCYGGELNGVWTPLTRKAMQALTDRVNAELPIGEPDQILLTLVQGQQDRVCGAPCQAGQSLADDGRCLPNVILAQERTRASERTSLTVPHTQVAENRPSAITSWSTTTTTATPTLPLPGDEERMALAGPPGEQANAIPSAPGLPVPAAATVPPRPAYPKLSNFGQHFFKQLDRMGNN
jgi:hypothetical protein